LSINPKKLYYTSRSFWRKKTWNKNNCFTQGGEDPQDALSCRSCIAKEPLIMGLFCGGKYGINNNCITRQHHSALNIYIRRCQPAYTCHFQTCIFIVTTSHLPSHYESLMGRGKIHLHFLLLWCKEKINQIHSHHNETPKKTHLHHNETYILS